MLALQSGAKLSDPTYDEGGNRFAFTGDTYYLRPAHEMREVWRDYPEACDNTLLVAERCEVTFRTARDGANFMPRFQVAEGEGEHRWFVKEVERGRAYRYPHGVPDHVDRQ